MPVVTIQGEMGSRASEIGKQVADRLHASYFDSDIAARVAQQANSSEREVKAKELPTQFLTQLAEAASSSFIYEAATLPSAPYRFGVSLRAHVCDGRVGKWPLGSYLRARRSVYFERLPGCALDSSCGSAGDTAEKSNGGCRFKRKGCYEMRVRTTIM